MPEVDIDKVLDWSERISNMIGMLLSMLLTIQMFGDILGINVAEVIRIIITTPWVIPKEWIEMYAPLWFTMEVLLLMTMLADNIYSTRYLQEHKVPPPLRYERWVSLLMFILSFWLAIIFRYLTFTLIAIFSSISFAYTMFIKRE